MTSSKRKNEHAAKAMTSHRRRNERGAALLLAIFGLVLLTSVALTMLFSADTETMIALNYRDKQVAIYAALAGVQEARDRIHPCAGDLGKGTNGDCSAGGADIVPKALPTASNGGVFYIINPAPGETVHPWDPNNSYFDTELCQERYAQDATTLNIANHGSPGVPCPKNSGSVPSTSCTQVPGSVPTGWCSYYDNSAHTTSWKLRDASNNPVPLNYKWVRITLKANNMTPVAPNGNLSDKTQVCLTQPPSSLHEVTLPTGYRTDCAPPSDTISSLTILDPGVGYVNGSHPTVTFQAPSVGTTATATATASTTPTGITGVTPGNVGSGYTVAHPAVTIDPPGGGGLITATVDGYPVSSVTLTNGTTPACYPIGSTLTPVFSTVYGSGASGTVTLTANRCIYSFSASGQCGGSGQSGAPASTSVTATGGSGSGFSGTISYNAGGSITGVSVTNGGNYSTMPTAAQLSAGCSASYNPSNAKIDSVTYGVAIQSVNVTAGGNYLAAPSVTFSGAAPKGAGTTTGAGVLGTGGGTVGQISTYNIDNAGSYYVTPTLTIAPPGGTGTQATATAQITLNPVGVTSLALSAANFGGSGYAFGSCPTVTIADPPPGPGARRATAKACVGTGGYDGRVYLLTSMAQTTSGARAMVQMEVAAMVANYTMQLGGALTLAGPAPQFGTPNSQNFVVNGNECHDPACRSLDNQGNSIPCTCPSDPPGCNAAGNTLTRPAIGAWDAPNETGTTAVSTILAALGKPDNYIGAGGESGSNVVNSYGTLGGLTVEDLNSFVTAAQSVATNVYNSDPGNSLATGSAANPVIDVVNGDLTLGPQTGYGILVVTGTLRIGGNYGWNGLILVIGSGASIMNGGGNGQINGAIFVANTNGATLGSPSADWSGGGGNGIQYDYCWADYMMSKIPTSPALSANSLQVISLRMLEY